MIQHRVTYRVFAWCASVLLWQGITSATPPDTPDELLQFFQCQPATGAELPPIDILIDDSISMRGFVNSEHGGRYRAMVKQLLENGVGEKVQIRRLSTPTRDLIQNREQVFAPTMYSNENTLLQRAFEFAQRRKGHVVILVSDLEQSTSDGDARDATSALETMLGTDRKHIMVLGIRSAYSNQRSPRCSPTCPSQGSRYLYLMVMAESPAALRLFVDRTHIDKFAFDDKEAARNGWPLFYSSRPALEVTGIELLSDPARGHWMESRETANVACADQALAHLQASFSYRGAWPNEPLRLLVKVTVNAPVDNFSSAVPEMNKIVRPRSARPLPFPATGLSHSARGQAFITNKTVRLEYNFRKPTPRTWDVYQVWFKSKPAHLEIPLWVSKWNEQVSATSDGSPAVAELVRTMLRVVTEKEPLLEHYIAIGQD